MNWRRGTLLVCAFLLLAACGSSGGSGSPENPGRLEQQARDALARWNATGFIPVGELTGQIGDWEEPVGGNNKLALITGNVLDKAGLSSAAPAPGKIQWADGRSQEVPVLSAAQAFQALVTRVPSRDCQGCTPLEITDARLSTRDIATSRGKASVPVWEFTLQGTRVIVTRVAVEAATVTPPPWDANNPPAGLSVESATVSPDGKHVTAHFTGSGGSADKPCGADYSAYAIEGEKAIVVIIVEKHHQGTGACTMEGYARTAIAELATPLGERAVLEVRQGLPVPVTLEAQ